MSEKEDRWPDFWRASTFQSDKKGTPKYRVEMAKKRIEDGEFVERYGPGPDSGPVFHFKPRYSNYNPFNSGSERNIEEAVAEEKGNFTAALAGDYGPEMMRHANKYGLRGIAEAIEITPAGFIVRDLLDPVDAPKEFFVTPDRDASGLWELQSNWENPSGDGRVKDDWRLEPVWEKGTRFVLRRNQHAMDMNVEALEDALVALNEPGSNATEEGKEEQARKIKAKLANKNWLLHQSGFEIRKAGARGYTFIPMRKMPEGFDRDLRRVPILDAQDAFDLIDFAPSNLRQILAYLVDGESSMVAWRLANLLEQASEGLGYFEPIPGIDFDAEEAE